MIVNAHLGEVTHRFKSGKTRRWTPRGPVYRCRSGKLPQVVDAVWNFRAGGASFLVQKGIYQDERGGRVTEDSVQIILLDFDDKTEQVFTEEVTALGAYLRGKFDQDSVVVEIQKKGVVTDVYSITG